MPDEILGLFEQHPWPGNLRQLVSVVRIALAMADDDPLQSWHLPDDFFLDLERPLESPVRSAANEPFVADDSVEEAIGADSGQTAERPTFERERLETVRIYNLHEGNISQTARELCVSRNTLYKRLR